MNSPKPDLPRLAYLVNEYPKPSHTFIRREIVHLEAMGHQICRVSIRPPETLVDDEDIAEADKTFVLLEQSTPSLLSAAARAAFTRPGRVLRALGMTWKMSQASERGLVRFLAYLVEACYLLGYFERENVGHVHVHFATNGANVTRLLKCLGGPTYSLTIHGPDEFDAPIGGSLGEKVCDAEFVAAITHYCTSQIRRWIPYEHWHKVRIVHCSVGDSFFDAAEPIADGADTLLSIGRLTPQKGQLVMVDAFAKFKSEGHRGRLVFVGDGELRDVVEERIRAHGLEDDVEITGWLGESDIRAWLKRCRVFVLPSFAEGLPVVIMEALAMERPVITTYVAGIPELVQDGVNGWLVPASDSEALGLALNDAMTRSVDVLRDMGKAGRKAVRENHYAPTEAAKIDALFREFVSPRGVR